MTGLVFVGLRHLFLLLSCCRFSFQMVGDVERVGVRGSVPLVVDVVVGFPFS